MRPDFKYISNVFETRNNQIVWIRGSLHIAYSWTKTASPLTYIVPLTHATVTCQVNRSNCEMSTRDRVVGHISSVKGVIGEVGRINPDLFEFIDT